MAITLGSSNILADSYVNAKYFPHTPPAQLHPANRLQSLSERLCALAADIWCLQEIEQSVFEVIGRRQGHG
ncbi:MAG: hypothetical protein EXR79_03500 [Myxococcales bacterium]|nr:hypothetical protein [Myxococcales bacterium]